MAGGAAATDRADAGAGDVELAEAERDLLVALWGGALSLRGLWRRVKRGVGSRE